MINLKSIKNFESYNGATDNLLGIDLYFCVDNRELTDESIFIAIVGEKYNPLKHLDQVVESGCKFVVYQASEENFKLACKYEDDLVLIAVRNIETFIQEAGHFVAKEFRARGGEIIAISGSNGKTTTKEMLYHILLDENEKDSVICTQKNNNNHLGVPFTLFQIREKTKHAIVELGSNHPGEIGHLCKMIEPDYGVTTNIGATHLEFFGTLENVYKEEGILHKYCGKNFFKNEDDEYLKAISVDNGISFGESGQDKKFIFDVDEIQVNEDKINNQHITGKHNRFNLALAYTLAATILPSQIETFRERAATFKPTANRSQWIEKFDKKIFLDAYNANPSSMKVAIEGFIEALAPIGADPAQSCLILGDMNELGEKASEYHSELGQYVSQFKIGKVFFVGRYADDYARDCALDHEKYKSTQELINNFDKSVALYNFLFIKGSRSLQLESILDIK